MREIPKFISVDDHVVEAPDLWQLRLPARFRDRAPRVERIKGTVTGTTATRMRITPGGDDDRWGDQWVYGDYVWPLIAGYACVGPLRSVPGTQSVTYDEIHPGCWNQAQRLVDLKANHTDASFCFPTFPRFCGQTFAEQRDKELGLQCVRVYNDWMIDEWCSGEACNRLIPLTIIPLWDADLAANEVRRCADKGSHAVCFSENPTHLGLPSIHTRWWDPFFSACEDTDTVINIHFGSSSQLPTTSVDAPLLVTIALTTHSTQGALADWLTSGILETFPKLRIALSEGQVGWMPFLLDRLDSAWERSTAYDPTIFQQVPARPSSYINGRIWGCIFDDLIGLESRHRIGMSQLLFETDYPHTDSTWPISIATAAKLAEAAGLDELETWQFFRGNAIECYGLARNGYEAAFPGAAKEPEA
jgi:predicted TIM-barrel fold metal-dependent hydrolase